MSYRRISNSLIVAGISLFLGSINSCGRSGIGGGLAKLHRCRLANGEKALCGKLRVLENRRSGGGRTIDLNIVVLPALDQKAKAEPIFDFAGGPGEAAGNDVIYYGDEYRRRHDIVLVDFRGTGGSNRLSIPREKTPQSVLSQMFPVGYVKSLRDNAEQHADLTQYTTSIAVDDVDDVRSYLGYDQLNLIGASYGTRAALVYLRQHPEHVRTITLLGVAPVDLKMPMYHARSADRATNLLLQECEQDVQCHTAFPRIRDDWKNVLTALDQSPAKVEYTDKSKGPVTVEIERGVFAEKIRNFLYSREKGSRVPLIIHRAARGDFTPFLHEAVGSSILDAIADGMYLCVTCAEDVPFIDQAEAAKLNADNPFGNYRVFQQTRACEMWPRAKIPADYREAVRSNVPALIFSGNLDPVAPPEQGEEVARYLPNSRHVIIPEGDHVYEGLTNQDCVDKLVIEFLDKADAKNLDVTCVETMKPPPFATN
jgi:pimeloyl-ACP methyl ester carboxylesterase